MSSRNAFSSNGSRLSWAGMWYLARSFSRRSASGGALLFHFHDALERLADRIRLGRGFQDLLRLFGELVHSFITHIERHGVTS